MTFLWSHGTAAVFRQRFFYISCCLSGLVLLLAGCSTVSDDSCGGDLPHLMLIDCRSGKGKILSDEVIDTSESPQRSPVLPLAPGK